VSNVLNRPQRVRPATREKVEQAMAELGFVRNEGARQLRAGRSSALAYVMLDARNPFFTDVAQGIEDAAADEQLSLFICNSAGSPERERAHLEHLQEQRVQGILITPIDPEAEILFGCVHDDSMAGNVKVTVIATGFDRPDVETPFDEKVTAPTQRHARPFLRGDDSGGFGPNASSRDDFDIPTVLRRQMD